MKYLKITRPTDEDVVVLVCDGHAEVEFASADHDSHGWSGMELLVDTVRGLASEFDIRLEEEEGE